jgi:galactokinase
VVHRQDTKDVVIVVTNSKVKHELTGSEYVLAAHLKPLLCVTPPVRYPTRVAQCREGRDVLQSQFPEVEELRDATLEMLDSVKGDLEV